MSTIKLKVPIQFGTQTISELTFRKPKAKDFRRLPAGPASMGDILDLVGQLTAQPKAVIDELDVDDMSEVCGMVESFMPSGPATGPKP